MTTKADEVQIAISISATAHLGQRYGNKDYFGGHICKVVDNVFEMDASADAAIVAYLHDVVEDTKMTSEKLGELGISSENVERVSLLSRKKRQSEEDYLASIQKDEVALKVKIADSLANLSQCLYDNNHTKAQKYIRIIKSLTNGG